MNASQTGSGSDVSSSSLGLADTERTAGPKRGEVFKSLLQGPRGPALPTCLLTPLQALWLPDYGVQAACDRLWSCVMLASSQGGLHI